MRLTLLPLTFLGPGYRSDEVFDLVTMQPYSVSDLLNQFLKITKDLVLYLPRTSDLRQLVGYQEDESKITVIHYCMEGASKVNNT